MEDDKKNGRRLKQLKIESDQKLKMKDDQKKMKANQK